MSALAPTTFVPSSPDWSALQASILDDVILPGSPGYDATRKPAIANFHHVRPQAIVRCYAPEDVTETILFVRRYEVPTVARSGGHCFAGRSSSEGVVIDVSPMHAVTVSCREATIGAGAQLGKVYTTYSTRTAWPSRQVVDPPSASPGSPSVAGLASSGGNMGCPATGC